MPTYLAQVSSDSTPFFYRFLVCNANENRPVSIDGARLNKEQKRIKQDKKEYSFRYYLDLTELQTLFRKESVDLIYVRIKL
jgi:hypothetical protein